MPFLLDTDHLSILHRRSQPECDRLVARLEQHPPDDIGTTIISFQRNRKVKQQQNPSLIVRRHLLVNPSILWIKPPIRAMRQHGWNPRV